MSIRCAALANSADGVFAVDLDQNIVLWNRAAASILGHAPEEVLGRKCFEVIRGRGADDCAICRRRCAAIEAAERGEFPVTADVATRRKSGDEIWLNVTSVVIPSALSERTTLVHLFREVTKRKRIVRLARELAEAINGRKTLAALDGDQGGDATIAIRLTFREREVLAHLAAGRSTEEIATILCVSPYTVRNHVSGILKKLGLHSRLQAITHAMRNGLI